MSNAAADARENDRPMSKNTERVLWGAGLLAAIGIVAGVATFASSAKAAAEPAPKPKPTPKPTPQQGTWTPAALTPYQGVPGLSDTGMGYVLLGPGSFRISWDVTLNADPIQQAKIAAWVATLPTDGLTYYGGTPQDAPVPADWPSDDRAPSGRVRASFDLPAAQAVTVPQAFGVRVWKLT